MIFGGTKLIYENSNTASVSGFGNFGEVFFTLFRLTLVDDYDFDVSIYLLFSILQCISSSASILVMIKLTVLTGLTSCKYFLL